MVTSTTDAKHVVVSDMTKEALWIGQLACTFWQANLNSAPIVYNDSQGVIALSRNSVHHNSSKNIDVRSHFIRDYITKGKLDLEKISTADNVVDGMTKCLSADRFQSLRHQMGVRGSGLVGSGTESLT